MILTLVTFLFVLSLLVLVHEGGHFWVAKKAGIKVEEFGFGYPPRIFGKKIKGTIYSLNAIPFGGFVRLSGEELSEASLARNTFWSKGKKARAAVIVAGVLANFLLAILAFAAIYTFSGIPTKSPQVKIVGILPSSPAQMVGLKEGDLVLRVEGKKVESLAEFTRLVKERAGQETEIGLKRGDSELNVWLTPRKEPPADEGPLGVVVTDVELKKYPFWQMPFRGLLEGAKETFSWIKLTFASLVGMISNLVRYGAVPKEIAGPVGIFQVSGMAARAGWLGVLQFIGILSVNLAVLNILPFPALDGGRLVFVAYEAVFRRRPKASFEHRINAVGMALIMLLLLLVTINDVNRILETSSLFARLRSLWPF